MTGPLFGSRVLPIKRTPMSNKFESEKFTMLNLRRPSVTLVRNR